MTWKASVSSFILNDIESVLKLSRCLQDGTYKEQPQKSFKIYEPKERDILSLAFKDRVYQRSLNDNGIYPYVSKSLIYDNAACQKNKGTDFARRRLKMMMQKHFRKYGTDGYVLQMDINGYYPNMSHELVKRKFKKHLEPEIYALVESIIDNFPNDKGFNPGSQLIQLAGISFLDELDHYAKERLLIKHYIRYMDDIIIITDTKEKAENFLKEIKSKIENFDCKLNEAKTIIFPFKHGIKFLGFKFNITDTGKIFMIVNPEKVKRYRKKLRRLVKKAKLLDTKTTKDDVDRSFKTFCDYISKGNSFNLIKRLEKFYNDLWKEGKSSEG